MTMLDVSGLQSFQELHCLSNDVMSSVIMTSCTELKALTSSRSTLVLLRVVEHRLYWFGVDCHTTDHF